MSRALQAVSAAVLGLASASAAHAAFEYHAAVKNLVVQSADVPSLQLNEAELPEAIVGAPYSPYDFKSLAALSGSGAPAVTALSWGTVGPLPAGMSMTASGVLSGTPTVKNEAGAPIQVQASYLGLTGQQSYALRILDPVVSLSAVAPPAGTVGQAYTFDFKSRLGVTGDPNFNPSLASFSRSGTLPAGLTLGADGVVSGTPTAVNTGDTSFQVIATYKTKSGQQAYTIVVNGVVYQVTQISAASHACAVTTAGGLVCWGNNASGQLGDGTTTNRTKPVAVVGLSSGVASVATGGTNTCALTTAGGVKCWGSNSAGSVGDGTTTDRRTPVDVQGLTSGVASVSTAGSSACALTTEGGVKCWGNNTMGQLGDGTMTTRLTPVSVSGLASGVIAVSSNPYNACVLTSGGGVKCWGYNNFGQLGDGSVTTRLTPVAVSGLASGVTQVVAGGNHTCAVTTTGTVKCWGYNNAGQLGDGSKITRYTPVSSSVAAAASSVVAGASHTCALTTSGGVRCLGANAYGQLGDGTTTARTATGDVLGLTSGVVALAGRDHNTCAILTTGAARCWGRNNYGQVGNGTTTDATSPATAVSP